MPKKLKKKLTFQSHSQYVIWEVEVQHNLKKRTYLFFLFLSNVNQFQLQKDYFDYF